MNEPFPLINYKTDDIVETKGKVYFKNKKIVGLEKMTL